MAEGGTETESYSEGSAEASDVICQPCDEEGERADAHGFCKVCKEHLCRMCIKIHHRTSVLKRHEIVHTLDISTEEDGSENTLRNSSFEKCPVHSKQYCKFYCPSHDVFGCGDCTVMDHRTCEIQYIPDVAKGFKDGKDYTNQQRSLEELSSTLETCIEKVNENTASVREISTNVVDTIKNFSSEIKATVDQRENEMLESAEKMKIEQETPLNQLIEECDRKKDEITSTKAKLCTSQKNEIMLFMASKRMGKKIVSIKTEVEKIEDKCERRVVETYEFKKNLDLGDKLSSHDILGTLSGGYNQGEVGRNKTNLEKAKFSPEPDIGIRSSEDKYYSHVTGITEISSKRLLIVDKYAQSCKLLDSSTGKLLSRLQMAKEPWDVATLPGNQAAVTVPELKQIQILTASGDKLAKMHTISTKGKCFGITYNNEKLAVSIEPEDNQPAIVEIRNANGFNTIISVDENGQSIFNKPRLIKMGKDGDTDVLYVSDVFSWNSYTITKWSMKGKVLSTYTDWDLNVSEADGLAVTDDGQILMCNKRRHSIHLLSPQMKSVLILNEKDGIKTPQAICYCAEEGKLYISSSDSSCRNMLKVYKIN